MPRGESRDARRPSRMRGNVMRLSTIASASALAVLLTASPVRAQDRWTVEIRGGANVNSNQFTTTDLKTGIGFGGALGVRILPDLFAYGGGGGAAPPTPRAGG